MRWSIRGATLCASLAVAGCALPPWLGHRPVFPSGGATAWAIPLYEPLTGLGPRVVATVCGGASGGKPRRCEEALLYVDSGSSHSALPAAALARLGVETTGSRFATIEDAAGERHAWSGGVVPEVRLGDVLSLTNVVTVVHDQTAILGGDVLTARGWRVDLDRGTLVLGAQPPSAGAARARLPVRALRGGAIADLSVQGRTVPLLLDTGAPFTVVDGSWLKALGLPLRTLAHGWPLSARDRSLVLNAATRAELRLGALELGQRQVVAHPRATGGPTRGMLGLDLLSDFAFGVTDGALELEPRAPSPLTSAPDRLARWLDLPRCPDQPGCATAQLEPSAGVGVHVRIRIAATPPRAQRYLFGCVDDGGGLRDLPIWIEIDLRAPAAGQEKVVEVPMPERLRQIWAPGCKDLALLDVNPVLPGVRPMTADVDARIAIASRRMRLD
jgi:predicted aspartyl protease